MSVYDLAIDVSGSLDLPGPLTTAVTVHLPEQLGPEAVVYFGFPGGGYGRHYFDIDTLPGYSQAAFHVERGDVFVCCDHLAVGESSTPSDPFALTYENLAAANDATARFVLGGLADGTLAPDVAPLSPVATFAMGQSMGGCLLTVQQAIHRTFDGIACLGWSGIFTNFPARNGGRLIKDLPLRGTALNAEILQAGAGDLDEFRYCFHWEDEEPALVEPDISSYVPFEGLPRGGETTPWGSSGLPPCAITMCTPGTVTAEAARIDVPVFVACGERDTVPDPWAEPAAYRSSPFVAVSVTPRMAHMHNFARTRGELWRRLDAFAHALAEPRNSARAFA